MTSQALMMSILSMDAYFRDNYGYSDATSGFILPDGTMQVGDATVSDAIKIAADGFGATKYELADGEIVISYRGTDLDSTIEAAKDVLGGWIVGAGVPVLQAQDAIEIYDLWVGHQTSDGPISDVVLTGHSLGGGLAGFIAALTGDTALLYDTMPFLSAAVVDDLGSLQFPNASNITTYHTDGEVLEPVRQGEAVAAELAYSLIPGARQALDDALDILNSEITNEPALDTHGWSGDLLGTEAHSSALLVLLQFANENGNTDWYPVASPILTSLFSNDIGKAIGLSNATGKSASSDQMRDILAYSVLDGTTGLVFGNTGARALFDDADDLGDHYDDTVAEYAKPLAEIATQFGAALAYSKNTNHDMTNGVIFYDDDADVLRVDLTDAIWNQAEQKKEGSPTTTIVGQDDLVKTALGDDGITDAQLDTIFSKLWETTDYHLIKGVVLSLSNEDQTVTLQSVNNDGVGLDDGLKAVELDILGGGNDTITGTNVGTNSSGNDFVSGGAGNDTIDGGDGHDLLSGGDGDDTFIAGKGTDFIGGGDGTDTVDYSESTDSIRKIAGIIPGSIGIQHGNQTDELFGVEKLRGTDLADSFSFSLSDLVTINDVSTFDGLQEIDEGPIDPHNRDVLDLSGLGVSTPWDVDHVDGVATKFVNFGEVILGSSRDQIRGAYGQLIYTGGGNDDIEFSSGVGIADLSTTDRINIGDLHLFGGLRPSASASPWAVNSSNGVEYGIDSAGELVIHVPWWQGAGDMYVLNYDKDAVIFGGAQTGPGNITIGQVSVSVFHILDAPPNSGSVESQLNLFRIEMATLLGLNQGADPLVLDLDGNGFDLTELTSVSPVFDDDADLYGEQTGWVLPSDGFLVRDINGNGKIDDGREMFSSAGSGFAALAELDGNGDGLVNAADNGLVDFNGDGVIDASDAFSSLKVWVDANQNGITDPGELHALSEYNITAFSLATTDTNETVADNLVTQTASYIRGDGSTGAVGDVILGLDNTNTVYHGPPITITAEAAAEPDLKGFGTLVSLHQALSLHPELLSDVNAAIAAIPATPELGAMKSAILPILYDWAAGSPELLPNGTELSAFDADPRNASPLVMLENQAGTVIDMAYDTETSTTTVNGTVHQTATWKFVSGATFDIVAATGGELPDISQVASAFGAETSFTTASGTDDDGDTYVTWTYTYANDASVVVTFKPDVGGFPPPAVGDVLSGTALTSNQWDENKAPEVAFYERYMGEQLDFNTMPSDVNAYLAALNGFLSAMDTSVGYLTVRLAVQAGALSPIFDGIHYDANSDGFAANDSRQLEPVYQNLFVQAQTASDPIAFLQSWKPFLDIMRADFSQGESGVENTYGFLAQNIIGAYEAIAPTFNLLDAADALGVPRDLFITGAGEMDGTDNADIFYIDGSGQTAIGGLGLDTYVVGQHVGTTVIDDVEPVLATPYDDIIRFTTLNPGDLDATRDGTDLVLTVKGTGESLRVTDQFTGPFPGLFGVNAAPDNGVGEIVFADGTVWEKIDMAMAVARVSPTGGVQTGTTATDYFMGGPGDDTLEGAGSSDIYVIGPNQGNDVINDLEGDPFRNSFDAVSFVGGITPDDLTYERDGASGDVTIGFKDTSGTLTIQDQFTATETGVFGTQYMNQIELFVFDDGESFSAQDLMLTILHQYETSGDDQIYGYSTDDVIDGGLGNDYISGRNGSDTYVINLGDGQDEIFDNNTNLLTGQTDTIAFGTGISRSDVTFIRSGDSDDLLIAIGNAGQTVKVDDQFVVTETGAFGAWAANQIELFTFADGTSVSAADVQLAVIASSETSGNDFIYGFHGDDTLEGGAGDDYMSGGDGDDTYIVNLGDGQDEIFDNNGNLLSGQDDTLQFGAGITLSDLTFHRDGSSNDLTIDIGTDGQSVKIDDQFGITLNWWSNRIETFAFSDGTSISWLDVMQELINQSEGGDFTAIYGFTTDDTLVGSSGNDFMSGLNGNDTYEVGLGGGQDEIFDNNTNLLSGQSDTLAFGPGISLSDLTFTRQGASNDLLISIGSSGQSVKIDDQFDVSEIGLGSWAPNQIETFTFADGSSITANDIQLAVLASSETSGSDAIYGFYFDDTLEGGAGDDYMSGGDGNDTYIINLGDGHDEILDNNGNLLTGQDDTIQFGTGIARSDLSFHRDGDSKDLLIGVGTTGQSVKIDDQFDITLNWWPDRIETFAFADGTSITWQDVIDGLLTQSETSGDDTIYGFTTSDTLAGGAGNDYLNGEDGDDTYLFGLGDGSDTIEETAGNDTVQFGAGITAAELVITRDGDDALIRFKNPATGQVGSDTLRIITQFDEWHNSPIENFTFVDAPGVTLSQSDLIAMFLSQSRTAGNDTIVGTQGSETLDGGFGDDLLEGGDGNDTYIFDRYYGNDTILDFNGNLNYSSTDTIQFGSGLSEDGLTAVRQNDDLLLSFAGDTTDSLRIEEFFTHSWYEIENFDFADGVTWHKADILARLQANPVTGTSADDTLVGTANADLIDGKGGDDIAQGGGGGSDASMADTFVFNLGYGHLDIQENDTATAPHNVLAFGAGITPQDLAVTASGHDILFLLSNGDQVRVENMYDNAFDGSTYRGVQSITFADGTVWSQQDAVDAANSAVIYGTDGADSLLGSSAPDRFDGLGGNDYEQGNGGNDTFIFDAGYGLLEIDEAQFSVGSATLELGAGIASGDITISGSADGDAVLTVGNAGDKITLDGMMNSADYGVAVISFADGTSWTRQDVVNRATAGTSGDDSMYGSRGADTFDGHGGNDYAQGRGGSDTFIFNSGYGHLEIDESDTGFSADNELQLGAGIDPDSIAVAEIGSDFVLTDGVSGDRITLDGQVWDIYDGVQSIHFADGTVWTTADLANRAIITGTDGDDELYGTGGNDTFDAGLGNDTISVSDGSDTFLYALGDGSDTIDDDGFSASDTDTLRFTDLSRDDVTFARNGLDLLVTMSDGAAITITNQFAPEFGPVSEGDGVFTGPGVGIEAIAFADGSTMSRADILAAIFGGAIEGTSGDDTLTGTTGDELVVGGEGDDILIGGGGRNVLVGGSGADTYVVSNGDVSDTIQDTQADSETNVLSFGVGVSPSDIQFGYSEDGDLILTVGTDGTQIILTGMLADSSNGVQQVTFADGTVWTAADVLNMDWSAETLTGTVAADRLFGNDLADTVDGSGGSDYVEGHGGGDTFIFNAGYGRLEINESEYSGLTNILRLGSGLLPTATVVGVTADGAVTLDFGNGDIVILDNMLTSPNAGVQEIDFANGTVWGLADIRSRIPADVITGTAGDDNLEGTTGSDNIDGLGGWDFVTGNGGGDTFIFNSGYGELDIDESDSISTANNVLSFGAGINSDDVTESNDGSGDIVLTVGTGGDVVYLLGMNGDTTRGVQHVHFADGTDWTAGYLLANLPAYAVTGTAGDDELTGSGGNDIIDGLGGTDVVNGWGGNDTFIFNPGYGSLEIQQWNLAADADNVLQLGNGIDPDDVTKSLGAGGALVLTIASGGDQIQIDAQDYQMPGIDGDGIQRVTFADGTVWSGQDLYVSGLSPTTGDDQLFGTAGADVIDGLGAASYDVAFGDGGGDTFVFDAGYGELDIYDYKITGSNENTLAFGAGINPGDISVEDDGYGDFVFSRNGSDDIVYVWGMTNDAQTGVQRISFADGTVWSAEDLRDGAILGTASSETLTGTDGADIFDGAGGADTEIGNGGGDTFIFQAGYGALEIDETDTASTPSNTLSLGSGISASDVSVSTDAGGDIVLTISGSDTITLDGMANSAADGVQAVDFADGTSWDRATALGLAMPPAIEGTTGNDTLEGTTGADTFDGKGGNDTITGDGGNDTFLFNAGYGVLEVTEYDDNPGANNVLKLGAGINPADLSVWDDGYGDAVLYDNVTGDNILLDAEIYSAQAGVQQIQFQDGTVWTRDNLIHSDVVGTTGDDTLDGTAGNDIFDGLGGTDVVGGWLGGNDTYLFNQGYGILEITQWNDDPARQSTLVMGPGMDPGQFEGWDDGYGDLVFYDDATGDQVLLDAEISSSRAGVQRVVFSDSGTVWTRQDLLNLGIVGTSGNNTLTGTSDAEFFQGNGGVDTINGGGGNDVYIFKPGDGQLTINNVGGSGAHSLIEFSDDFTDEDLWFTHTGNNLVVQKIGSTDKVTVSNWFGSNTSAKLSEITLDGNIEIDSQLNSLISAMATYKTNHSSFNPTTAMAMPTDTTLQNAIAASWHS